MWREDRLCLCARGERYQMYTYTVYVPSTVKLSTLSHTPERVKEEDLLQLHSALTEGLSCVINFLLVVAAKDHPPEELVRYSCGWVGVRVHM